MSKDSRPRPRAELVDLPAYQGGRETVQTTARVFKLSANESALGPSPRALSAYQQAGERLASYPGAELETLRAQLAERHGLIAEQIVCGNGSDEILSLLASAYLGRGDEAIITQYGFLMFKLATQAAGGVPVMVAEQDLTANINAILAAVSPRTRLVFLANPNNPTGTLLPMAEIARLAAGLPPHVLLVLDGAYAEFVPPDELPDAFALVGQAENIVATRTFSKAYGLAALRIGWGYCPPAIADILNRHRAPFNVNAAACAAACAALNDQAHLQAAVAHNTQWRDFLRQQIGGLGFAVLGGAANFLLIKFADKNSAAQADAFLSERGLLLRALDAYGLPDMLRLTIGCEEANRALVAALADFAAR